MIQNLPLIALLITIETNGYDDKWIKQRLTGVIDRHKLTDVWKESGITKNYEYGILTNEIYRQWSGMKASQYKEYKGLRKESLRDNMTDIEVTLANLGEIATRELVKLCTQVLSDNPVFFLINSYTTGISSTVLENLLRININQKGEFENGEIGLPMTNSKLILPCGIYAKWTKNNI